MNQPGRSPRRAPHGRAPRADDYPVARGAVPPPNWPAPDGVPVARPVGVPIGVPVGVPVAAPGRPVPHVEVQPLGGRHSARPRFLRNVLVIMVGAVIGVILLELGGRMLPAKPAKKPAGPAVAVADTGKGRQPAPTSPIVATPVPPPETKPEPTRPAATKPSLEPTPEPSTRVVLYDKQVAPVFQARCVSCHGATKPKGNYDMRTLASVVKGGTSGVAVRPGTPKDSVLWERIADNSMPPGKDKLSEDEKTLIRAWIAGGAKATVTVAQAP